MTKMLAALLKSLSPLLKSLSDLFDARVLAVIVRSLAITVAVFVALAVMLVWTLKGADLCAWANLGRCPLDGTGGAIGGVALTLLASWLLFPAVALGVLTAFVERIVAAVEARNYPESLGVTHELGLTGTALLGLKSGARLLLINLTMLPFYLLLLVTGIGPFILFVLVNGWAAGQDFGEMVAARRGDRSHQRLWLRATRADRTGIGVVCACLFLVPILNLLAPVIGAAAVTHLYHRRRFMQAR
jgi:hypothetical protein